MEEREISTLSPFKVFSKVVQWAPFYGFDGPLKYAPSFGEPFRLEDCSPLEDYFCELPWNEEIKLHVQNFLLKRII